MSITTTCIGAYPRPDYVEIGNFAETGAPDDGLTRAFSYTQDSSAEVPEELLLRATQAAIHDQIEYGIDIPGDGEQRRENHLHYHCRHLHGIDFENLTNQVQRNAAAVADLPTINGK